MIQARESERLKDRLVEVFMQHTGRPRETIEHDLDRDTYFDAQRAVEYGLIDSVLEQAPVTTSSNGHSKNGKHG
jgi:ATP-dependent Clp protease protease subunit